MAISPLFVELSVLGVAIHPEDHPENRLFPDGGTEDFVTAIPAFFAPRTRPEEASGTPEVFR